MLQKKQPTNLEYQLFSCFKLKRDSTVDGTSNVWKLITAKLKISLQQFPAFGTRICRRCATGTCSERWLSCACGAKCRFVTFERETYMILYTDSRQIISLPEIYLCDKHGTSLSLQRPTSMRPYSRINVATWVPLKHGLTLNFVNVVFKVDPASSTTCPSLMLDEFTWCPLLHTVTQSCLVHYQVHLGHSRQDPNGLQQVLCQLVFIESKGWSMVKVTKVMEVKWICIISHTFIYYIRQIKVY